MRLADTLAGPARPRSTSTSLFGQRYITTNSATSSNDFRQDLAALCASIERNKSRVGAELAGVLQDIAIVRARKPGRLPEVREATLKRLKAAQESLKQELAGLEAWTNTEKTAHVFHTHVQRGQREAETAAIQVQMQKFRWPPKSQHKITPAQP